MECLEIVNDAFKGKIEYRPQIPYRIDDKSPLAKFISNFKPDSNLEDRIFKFYPMLR